MGKRLKEFSILMRDAISGRTAPGRVFSEQGKTVHAVFNAKTCPGSGTSKFCQ